MNEEFANKVFTGSLPEETGLDFTEYSEYFYEFKEEHGDLVHVSVGFKMELTNPVQLNKFQELIKKYRPLEILAGGYDEKARLLGFANQNPGHFSENNSSFAVYSKQVIRKF